MRGRLLLFVLYSILPSLHFVIVVKGPAVVDGAGVASGLRSPDTACSFLFPSFYFYFLPTSFFFPQYLYP